MKFARVLMPTLAAIVAAVVLTGAAPADTKPNPAWEKMKSLVGDWEGTANEENQKLPVKVSYRLVSSGTSLMETLNTPDGNDMITMYVPDGDHILMTHYCSEGNQPRMRAAVKGDASKVDFQYLDGTNVSSGPAAMHMERLVVTFQDADHFRQEWTHRAGGKDAVGVFDYTRKK